METDNGPHEWGYSGVLIIVPGFFYGIQEKEELLTEGIVGGSLFGLAGFLYPGLFSLCTNHMCP